VARNRYGWEKRAKEIARKQKSEEKLKRRRSKDPTTSEAGSETEPQAGEEPELTSESEPEENRG
jgi:hypothetical protein